MNKEQFLHELKHNLRYLKKKDQKEELTKYQDIDTTNLDPIVEANKIYENKGLKIRLIPKIKFLDALNIIIECIRNKNEEAIKKIIKFALYLILLVIVIKIPFIYVRDLTSTLFNNLFVNDNVYVIWNIAFELLYALTTILIFINLIKKKANELNKIINQEAKNE